jgi:uncharacterized protein (TIGR02246 family)
MSDALERLIDHIEIRELTARYNRAFDDVDSEAWADVFTPDGVMEYTGGEPVVGRDALVAMNKGIGYGYVHITTDPIIDVDGDRATQKCTVIVCNRSKDGSPVQFGMTGRYEDELVRTPDGWRFKRRVATLDAGLG